MKKQAQIEAKLRKQQLFVGDVSSDRSSSISLRTTSRCGSFLVPSWQRLRGSGYMGDGFGSAGASRVEVRKKPLGAAANVPPNIKIANKNGDMQPGSNSGAAGNVDIRNANEKRPKPPKTQAVNLELYTLFKQNNGVSNFSCIPGKSKPETKESRRHPARCPP